jgi:hypothetical protein
MEIFNILVFPFDKGKGNMHAKVQQLQVTQTQGVEEEPETAVSIVSKSISTLEDDRGRFGGIVSIVGTTNTKSSSSVGVLRGTACTVHPGECEMLVQVPLRVDYMHVLACVTFVECTWNAVRLGSER